MLVLLLISVLSSATIWRGECGRLEPQYLPPRSGGYASASAGAFSGASSSAASGAYSNARAYSGAGGGSGGANIPILKYENVNNGDGSYKYSYETGNGISAHESGAPRASGPSGAAVTAEGAFSYRAPDGQQVSLTYTADENGFHPVGSHIPTPPPIPEAILRSIEFNRRNPSSEGAYNSASDGYQY